MTNVAHEIEEKEVELKSLVKFEKNLLKWQKMRESMSIMLFKEYYSI